MFLSVYVPWHIRLFHLTVVILYIHPSPPFPSPSSGPYLINWVMDVLAEVRVRGAQGAPRYLASHVTIAPGLVQAPAQGIVQVNIYPPPGQGLAQVQVYPTNVNGGYGQVELQPYPQGQGLAQGDRSKPPAPQYAPPPGQPTPQYAPPPGQPGQLYAPPAGGYPAQQYAPPATGYPAQQYAPPPGNAGQQYAPPASAYPAQQYAPPPSNPAPQYAPPSGYPSQQYAPPAGAYPAQQYVPPPNSLSYFPPPQQVHHSPPFLAHCSCFFFVFFLCHVCPLPHLLLPSPDPHTPIN